ncbi:tetratricopeptide repeat protein [Collimonas sp.]|jgi:tetratricopeptide (TPR) repeat protein|uniref:tetratricopeptide repeat protein n=1 Tax=Collimonas sp. TaxID=1963772 RepID=UPI002C8C3A62|nr:tetratricopeptide repeat protein [Collimonas sp.]HWW07803.1 tetratricopeptide repeat protein [Collimonas sp.]
MENASQASWLSGQAQEASQQGRFDEALALWEAALEHDPGNQQYAIGLTNFLAQNGRPEQALQACDSWLGANPGMPLLWIQKGIIQINHLSDTPGAIDSFHAALRCEPDNSRAHEALAQIYLFKLQPELMRFHAAQAITNADLRSSLSIRCRFLSDYAGAIAAAKQMLAGDPADVETLLTMGKALYMQGRFDAALGMLARAVEHAPARVDVIGPFADLLLLCGDHRAGWRRLEALANDTHLRANYPGVVPYLDKQWRGQPLDGKRILVAYYAGIGDNLMMARFVRDLKAAGAHVTFACRPELLRLLQGMDGADEVAPDWQLERWHEFDYWVFDYLLPAYLGAAQGHIPAYRDGYLRSPAALKTHWAMQLQKHPARLKVGLCWYSIPHNFSGLDRFIPPQEFAPLAELEGIEWFILQKNQMNGELVGRSGLKAHDYSGQWQDFADSSAMIEGLDLVISIDSSPLHLAGALGKPVWGLLPAAPEWRWGLAGEQCSWYPTLRLFRQTGLHCWAPVIQRVKEELLLLL